MIAEEGTVAAALLAGGMLMLLVSVILGHVDNNTYCPGCGKSSRALGLADQLQVMKVIVMKKSTGSGLIIMVPLWLHRLHG